jgi:gamma-glutamylcyclotransferase (GGCT)/AIG2-like uncharacterized protein YtfP
MQPTAINGDLLIEGALYQTNAAGVVRIDKIRDVGVNTCTVRYTSMHGDEAGHTCAWSYSSNGKWLGSERGYDILHAINTKELPNVTSGLKALDKVEKLCYSA